MCTCNMCTHHVYMHHVYMHHVYMCHAPCVHVSCTMCTCNMCTLHAPCVNVSCTMCTCTMCTHHVYMYTCHTCVHVSCVHVIVGGNSAAQGEGEEGGRRWRRQGVGEGGGWGIQGVRGGEVLLDFVGDKLSGDEGGWVFCL